MLDKRFQSALHFESCKLRGDNASTSSSVTAEGNCDYTCLTYTGYVQTLTALGSAGDFVLSTFIHEPHPC